jgi:hypothetical protein
VVIKADLSIVSRSSGDPASGTTELALTVLNYANFLAPTIQLFTVFWGNVWGGPPRFGLCSRAIP